ncbi:hypothetical protein ACF0H5_020712 [Mactra antiquata]
MAGFLDALNGFYQNVRGEGDNDTSVEPCITKIPIAEFHIFLMIPSAVMILVLSLTLSRKNQALSCCWGRPGVVFPMDILGKSNRFSYAAAWGSIAFLATDLVFGSISIIQFTGPPYVTVFNKVCEVFIIGLGYFPMFAALAVESILGYIVGTAYAWTFLGVHIFRATECDLVVETRLILILRDLPNFLCLAYLSISLPVRTIQSLREKSVKFASASEMVSILNLEKEILSSPEAEHVSRLLKVIPPPPPPPETITGKIWALFGGFISDWIYHNKHKFRYSARILSVMLMGILLVYKATVELMVLVLGILKLVESGFIVTLDAIGWDYEENEEGFVTEIRNYTYLMYFILINGRICFIVSMSLACAGSILTILHMLSSYRTNLFDLYKGDNTHIPHRDTRSNTSLLVGSMRYAGYQVAYIAWGFVLHFVILFLLSLAICVIITMIQNDFYQWMLAILATAWPAAVMTIIILMTQTLLAKFAFLQENGNLLAINNRRWLFCLSFFLFFYNIFVGFLSCLLRIIKSIAIGASFLPRLDNSALPRRFQMFDPGFANYVGFIHVECAHTHPVMLMVLRLLLIDISKVDNSGDKSVAMEKGTLVEMNGKAKKGVLDPVRRKLIRNRWCVAYTLTQNPALRTHRKCYINYLKAIQDRLAKKYNITGNAMDKLVSHINNQYVATGSNNLDEVAEGVVAAEVRQARANWNALLGMSKLMQNVKTRDVDHQTINIEMDKGNSNGGFEKVSEGNDTNVFVRTPANMWKKAAFTAARQSVNGANDENSKL